MPGSRWPNRVGSVTIRKASNHTLFPPFHNPVVPTMAPDGRPYLLLVLPCVRYLWRWWDRYCQPCTEPADAPPAQAATHQPPPVPEHARRIETEVDDYWDRFRAAPVSAWNGWDQESMIHRSRG
jgi:hypothetical protein